jgi:hypothetical protein
MHVNVYNHIIWYITTYIHTHITIGIYAHTKHLNNIHTLTLLLSVLFSPVEGPYEDKEHRSIGAYIRVLCVYVCSVCNCALYVSICEWLMCVYCTKLNCTTIGVPWIAGDQHEYPETITAGVCIGVWLCVRVYYIMINAVRWINMICYCVYIFMAVCSMLNPRKKCLQALKKSKFEFIFVFTIGIQYTTLIPM